MSSLVNPGIINEIGGDILKDKEGVTGFIERIHIIQGDIAALTVDAIVNAASPLAKSEIEFGKRALEDCSPGEARITSGHQSSAKYIIHIVPPVYQGGDKDEAKVLYSCYSNSLFLAVENQVKTIAFPCLSTDTYGYPFQEGCRIAINAVLDFLQQPEQILKIFFVCHSDCEYKQFNELLSNRIK